MIYRQFNNLLMITFVIIIVSFLGYKLMEQKQCRLKKICILAIGENNNNLVSSLKRYILVVPKLAWAAALAPDANRPRPRLGSSY